MRLAMRPLWAVRSWLHAVALGLGLALIGGAGAVVAMVPDCETLAAQAGRAAGMPEGLLPAIARIEAGRSRDGVRRAWPWTLNHAGRGLYFETQAEALAYLRTATAKGRTNIDVGCMQINHYWHGAEFAGLEAMMEPANNIAYAVEFLRDLQRRHGSWAEAVRHYHSPDDARGARYYANFDLARSQILKSPGAPVAPTQVSAPSAAVPPRTPQPSAWPLVGLGGGVSLAGRGGLFGTTAPQGALLVPMGGGAILPGRDEEQALYSALIALAEARGAPLTLGATSSAAPPQLISDAAALAHADPDLSHLSPRLHQRRDEIVALRLLLAKP